MRLLLIALLFAACTPAAAAPAPTEDPRVATLTAERDDLQLQIRILQSERDDLWKRIADQAQQIQNPTFVTWDAPMTIHANSHLEGEIPDTFTARFVFDATTPVRMRIMSLPQYAQWRNTGNADGITYPATTHLDVVFHDAEGCAAYVVILDAERESVISPKFTVTHSPSRVGTGVCAN